MSDLPRLLLCSFDVIPAPTGSSRRMTEYLRGLSDHFTVVGLTAKTPDHPHIEKYEGARLLRVPVGSGDLPSKLQTFDRAVRRQLESEEYAVVHFTDPFGGYALCELRDQYGYKLVYDAQTFPSQELRFTHPQLEGDRKFLAKVRRQELFCLMNADRVITGSEVTRELIQSLGVSPENIEILRAPVDLEPYTEEAMGPPDAAPMRVLYLGSQVAWQGLPTLLRAMQHALREVDLRLVVVGPSHTAWQPLLDDLVEELKLGGKVEFQPPVAHADLHKVLALADVGVLPLEDLDRNRVQGGAASKVGEYLAAGRPVIASDLPMARELLTEDAALFHEPGDPEDISDCLVALAKNPKRRVRMGQAAFALARRQHDSETIRERIRQIYLELTGVTPAVRREDDEEAGGPAPTLIGTPLVHAAAAPKHADADPTGRSRTGRRKDGTDPAIAPTGARSAATRSAADKRRERRKRRRELLADENASATHPAARGDVERVVMGTPLRDDVPGTDPNASANEEPRVVVGTPLREEVEYRSTEPAAALSREPQVVMGTPLRESAEPRQAAAKSAREELEHGGTEPAATAAIEPRVVMGTPLHEATSAQADGVAATQQVSHETTPTAEKRSDAAEPGEAHRPPEPRPQANAKPPAGSVVFASGTPLEQVPQPKPAGSSVVFAVGTPLEAVPQPKLPPEAISKSLVSGTPLEALPQPRLPARMPAPAVVVTTTSKVTVAAPPAPRQSGEHASVWIDPELLGAPPLAATTQGAPNTASNPPPQSPAPVTAPPPLPATAAPPPLPATAREAEGPEEVDPQDVEPADDDGPAEISPDEVMEASAEPEAGGSSTGERPTGAHPTTHDPGHTTARAQHPRPATPDAVPTPNTPPELESADDAVLGPVDEPAPETASRLDAWFAQLVHGYCPPEGAQFARPTPPTNFPGREGPPPATVQPGAPAAQSIPSRSNGG